MDTKINTRITRVEAGHSETIRKMLEEWDKHNSDTKFLILGLCNGGSDKQTIQTPSTSSDDNSGAPGVTQ